VDEGAGYSLQPGQARELNPGDGLVAAGGSNVVVLASQLGLLRLVYFCVHPEFLNGLITVAEGHQLEKALKSSANQAIPFSAKDAIGQKFSRLAGRPQRESLAMRSSLLQLWSQALSGVLQFSLSQEDGRKLRERFRQLLAQMPDAELATRSLTELAGQLQCSERHFSRIFRKEFGVALRVRQTQLRLQHACELLANSEAKISDVAFESGYQHLGLFNSMFKKQFGMTPSEWRKKWGNPVKPQSLATCLAALLLYQFSDIFTAVGFFVSKS
jgi:AraC-like DNA-binding protein